MQRELSPAQKKDGQVSAGLFPYPCVSGLTRTQKMYFHARGKQFGCSSVSSCVRIGPVIANSDFPYHLTVFVYCECFG